MVETWVQKFASHAEPVSKLLKYVLPTRTSQGLDSLVEEIRDGKPVNMEFVNQHVENLRPRTCLGFLKLGAFLLGASALAMAVLCAAVIGLVALVSFGIVALVVAGFCLNVILFPFAFIIFGMAWLIGFGAVMVMTGALSLQMTAFVLTLIRRLLFGPGA